MLLKSSRILVEIVQLQSCVALALEQEWTHLLLTELCPCLQVPRAWKLSDSLIREDGSVGEIVKQLTLRDKVFYPN
jgi:hypothetical protein